MTDFGHGISSDSRFFFLSVLADDHNFHSSITNSHLTASLYEDSLVCEITGAGMRFLFLRHLVTSSTHTHTFLNA